MSEFGVCIVTFHHCRRCGCTDTKACQGGCFWVEPDLCSSCATSAQIAALPKGRVTNDYLRGYVAGVLDAVKKLGPRSLPPASVK